MSIGLIFVVAVILAVVVIPPSILPQTAVTPTWVIAIIHLLIVVALIWTIRVNKRGGRINKELLVAAGVIPIVLSLLILDGAFAYIDDPDSGGTPMIGLNGTNIVSTNSLIASRERSDVEFQWVVPANRLY